MAVATTNTNTLTLHNLMAEAQEIHQLLTQNGFNIKGAREKASNLFHQGITLFRAEIEGISLVPEIVSPVFIQVGNTLNLETIQHQSPLYSALGKVYCLFLELSWYQCWKRQEQPTFPETISKVAATTHKSLSVLPPESKVGARFEFQCAEEAAKMLKPCDSIWTKYATSAADSASAAMNAKTGAALSGLVGLIQMARKDIVASWYHDTFDWRWQAKRITNEREFDAVITEATIAKCRKEGAEYAICLAKVFMGIIKNEKAREEVRDRALIGKRGNGLAGIISWEAPGTPEDFAKHPTSAWNAVARKADRFWKARQLSTEYLIRLVRKPKYKSYREISRQQLRERDQHLQRVKGKRYQSEQLRFQQQMNQLETELKTVADTEKKLIGKMPDRVLQALGGFRGETALSSEDASKIEELRKISEDKEKLEKKVQEIKEQINQVSLIEQEMERIDEEEMRRLRPIFTSASEEKKAQE